MEIHFYNTGGIAESDTFIGLETCCPKFLHMLYGGEQFSINERGYVTLLPSKQNMVFCPFCGSEIFRINTCPKDIIEKTRKEIEPFLKKARTNGDL